MPFLFLTLSSFSTSLFTCLTLRPGLSPLDSPRQHRDSPLASLLPFLILPPSSHVATIVSFLKHHFPYLRSSKGSWLHLG